MPCNLFLADRRALGGLAAWNKGLATENEKQRNDGTPKMRREQKGSKKAQSCQDRTAENGQANDRAR